MRESNESNAMKRISRKNLALLGALVLSTPAVLLTGCIHRSGGEWMFSSAPRPDGWPSITEVGTIEVKAYPEYRAAVVDDESRQNAKATKSMFMSLFRHISRNDIPMTAPVDMGYEESDDGKASANSMAFLYRTVDIGELGSEGAIRVVDVPEQDYVTIGVRGSYSASRYARAKIKLESWLEQNTEWQAKGDARYLGYNSPFVLPFFRYGEVQIPVDPSIDDQIR
jgi:hypothetical protein